MADTTSTQNGPPTGGFYTKGDTVTDAGGTVWLCVVTGFAGYERDGGTAQFEAQPASVATMTIALVSVGAAGVETGLTAHAGGTQSAALALSTTKTVHDVTTVGSAADSVTLPAATGSGVVHIVKNSAAANSMQLFAVTTSTIDGVATGTGVAIAAGSARVLVDIAAGKWISVVGA